MSYFIYSDKELNYLKDKDKELAQAIDLIGMIQRPTYDDLFFALIDTIIGQQISTKAHATIRLRFEESFNPITPKHIASLDIDELQRVGLSFRKAEYIKGIARSILDKSLDLDNLDNLSDDEILKELVKLKGVGPWTAEMIMIFALKRTNIISYKDLAILRGMKMLYGLEEISLEFFEEKKALYAPYASVASIYLWEISTGKYDF